MISKSTHYAKQGEVQRNWVLVDADGAVLGRLATQIAMILRGKNKPQFTPNSDCGDFEKVIERAVRGMLPKTTLGRAQMTKLKVYAGAEHPHAAQNPTKIELEA